MRWIRYKYEDVAHFGRLDEDVVIEVSGTPFGGAIETGRRFPLQSVELLPPVQPVGFFAPAEPNHLAHILKTAACRNTTPVIPTRTDFNYRGVNSIIGDGDSVILPSDCCGVVQMEGELAVVIGKKAKRVSEQNAAEYIFGYTICNDISERKWQFGDRTVWRGKNTDTFNPIGPWIETDFNPDGATTHIRVNNQLMGSFPTGKMIFKIASLISALTQNITLMPGDVISTGADEPCPDLRAGDVAEVEIEGIGVLRNRIVAETAET